MSLHVWAGCYDAPTRVCEDARLRLKPAPYNPFRFGPALSSTDQTYGQRGWHVGLQFLTLDHLADQLERLVVPDYVTPNEHTIRRGELRRLAINAHGNAGLLHVGGERVPRAPPLQESTFTSYHPVLHRIGLLTPRDGSGIIYLMGCVAGFGEAGTKLLIRLSRVWPNRRVVGFIAVGFAAGGEMRRVGEHCEEPGMRDTLSGHSAGEGEQQAQAWGSRWRNLSELPWASEHSPSAKVALNGALIRGAHFDAAPASP